MKTDTKFTLRLPADLKAWAEERSFRNIRSLNSELIAILSAVRQGEDDDPQGFKRLGATYAQEVTQ